MNDNFGRGRGPRQPSMRRAWIAAAVGVTVIGVALLTSACGSGSSTSTSPTGSSQYAQEFAYTHCMRTHGVPNFPDPNSQGNFNLVQIGRNGVSQQTLQAAQNACRHLQSGSSVPGTAQQQQAKLAQALNFSKCMRAHGVPNYPDPTVGNGGIGYANLAGVNQSSPQYQAAQRACQSKNGPQP